MAMNFNIVQKPKKDDDLMDEDELELEESKSSSVDPKKKMIKFMAIIMACFFGFLIILFLISLISNRTRTYSYSEIEKIMKNAAIDYFKEHSEELPTELGDIIEVDSSNLVISEKMKDLSEYTKENVSCTGTVQVEKTGSGYLYTPYLDCGNSYATKELANRILEKEDIVTSGYGLYSTKSGHIYRGEIVNNYVQLDKSLWRIVKITSNNNIVLISEDGVPYTKPWDNRYNPDKSYESGINTYSNSRVKEFLEKVYTNPSEKDKEVILSKKDKKKLIPFNLCTAKRLANSEIKDNSAECSEVIKDEMMGLLTLSDYMYASVDENCKSASTKSCKNYNYLVKKYSWWLVTANKENTYSVFQVSQSGVATIVNASNYAIVRPVIYLNSKTLYKGGTGTLEDPYTVR